VCCPAPCTHMRTCITDCHLAYAQDCLLLLLNMHRVSSLVCAILLCAVRVWTELHAVFNRCMQFTQILASHNLVSSHLVFRICHGNISYVVVSRFEYQVCVCLCRSCDPSQLVLSTSQTPHSLNTNGKIDNQSQLQPPLPINAFWPPSVDFDVNSIIS
jgi:hypothetical protein